MMNETAAFFANLMSGQGSGKLEDAVHLHRSSSSMPSWPSSTASGVSPATSSSRPTLNPAERAGVLTQGTFLAAHSDADYSHPVKRGVHFLHKVLCKDIPLPTASTCRRCPSASPARPPGSATKRPPRRGPVCSACHKHINGAGFAFENYDAVGQYRTMEDGKPVDASGHLPLASGGSTSRTASSSARRSATTKEARDCMTKQFLATCSGGRSRRGRGLAREPRKAFAKSRIRHARAAGRHHQDARVHSPSAPAGGGSANE